LLFFPYRRAGFAAAPDPFPADVIVEIVTPSNDCRESARGLDGMAKPDLLTMRT
jgi:hypothetical protein